MKNRISPLSILTLFLLLFFASCVQEDERYYLQLENTEVILDESGNGKQIKLTASNDWTVENIPEWLSLDLTSGNGSAEIYLTATKNEAFTNRSATLSFVSGHLRRTLLVEQQGQQERAPFIELSKKSLSISLDGEIHTLLVTSSKPWVIENCPDWITVTPTTGNQKTEVTIQVSEHWEPDGRKTDLEFANSDTRSYLTIDQFGLKDVVRAPSLPIFRFSKVEFAGSLTWFSFTTTSLFVNSGIRDRVYMGNLLDPSPLEHTDIPEFTGYTFNPVTLTTPFSDSKEVIPTKAAQDAYAQQVMGDRPAHYDTLITSNLTQFYSYHQLSALGIANLGVKLDEIVSGHSYLEQEMVKKYGLVFAFKKMQFRIGMEKPEKLIQEELTDADRKKGASYVNSVLYGKIGLLIAESDTDNRRLQQIMDKVIAGKSLLPHEEQELAAASLHYIYFDNNQQLQHRTGNSKEMVEAYKKAIYEEDGNIYPVEFLLADMTTHSRKPITFSFKMPLASGESFSDRRNPAAILSVSE